MTDLGKNGETLSKLIDELAQCRRQVTQLLERGGYAHLLKRDAAEDRPVLKPAFTLDKQSLQGLRVACIMDTFTRESYAPECQLLELTPEDWRAQIDSFGPDLLFVESAWEGKDKKWYRKISGCSEEYFQLTSYCQEKDIPVVFWNKEDPVYTDTFMAAARMADFVFTTDVDCIPRYKAELEHDRVYPLHFAAQPRVHNPIEKFQRQDKFCFAGAYYHRYPQRAKVFDAFAQVFLETKGLDIYDRNYQNARPEHAFPRQYDPYILGKLEPGEIDAAYKGYFFGVNMNSVQQSQSMFARRVFEMLASNTVTVGNYSRGVRNLLGDLTICTDDEGTLRQRLSLYCSSQQTMDKYRLAGLRKVLGEHLYEDRLGFVVQKVFGKDLKRPLPLIHVVARVDNEAQRDAVLTAFRRQNYDAKACVLVGPPGDLPKGLAVSQMTLEEARKTDCRQLFKDGFCALFHWEDYYGPNYLTDLALALRYGTFRGIGKAARYENGGDGPALVEKDRAYREVERLPARACIQAAAGLYGQTLEQMCRQQWVQQGPLFAVDPFNYCQGGGSACPEADDLEIGNQGISLEEIVRACEQIRVAPPPDDGFTMEAQELLTALGRNRSSSVSLSQQGASLMIESFLPPQEHQYLQGLGVLSLREFACNGELELRLTGAGELNTELSVTFLDAAGKNLSSAFSPPNRNWHISCPPGAVQAELGLRVQGGGVFRALRLAAGPAARWELPVCPLARSSVLVLTNHYPSAGDLYRNMFVHRRILAYQEKGLFPEVFRMNVYAKQGFREFEGVDVTEGHAEQLADLLDTGAIDTVCVHFLDESMWEVLRHYLPDIRLLIWSHGADIQPWWRRGFLYHTEQERQKAQQQTEEKMRFWREVFSTAERWPEQIHFIFVSDHSAQMVREDYQVTLSPSICSIIPNCIDTDFFAYQAKKPEDRLKIISIRPFASEVYANDLSARAILALAKKPFFSKLSFHIVGDGPLFGEVTRPLQKFSNVQLEKRFLTQAQIRALYAQNGVVLIPSRSDTQGVSRDEAMSCGLVPVTNGVTAIPEFVDENCGFLAPAEDYQALADAIERLYHDPALFLKLSESAAQRVRRQSSKRQTTDREWELIVSGGVHASHDLDGDPLADPAKCE